MRLFFCTNWKGEQTVAVVDAITHINQSFSKTAMRKNMAPKNHHFNFKSRKMVCFDAEENRIKNGVFRIFFDFFFFRNEQSVWKFDDITHIDFNCDSYLIMVIYIKRFMNGAK